MPTLLARYLAGEHEAVWAELGTGRLPVPRAEVEAVARATMRRVRANVELLVGRLVAEGYPFECALSPVGEDAEARYFAVWAPPLPGTRQTLDEVERLVGALPLSVRGWYEEVGAVNFQSAEFPARLAGAHETAALAPVGPDDDPLMVLPIEYTLAEAREWLDHSVAQRTAYPFRWAFAPDVLHKANVSGGAPFGVTLPAPGADGIVEEEAWGRIPFVPYLREAFRWGGFPGLRRLPPERQQRRLVDRLCRGLLPF